MGEQKKHIKMFPSKQPEAFPMLPEFKKKEYVLPGFTPGTLGILGVIICSSICKGRNLFAKITSMVGNLPMFFCWIQLGRSSKSEFPIAKTSSWTSQKQNKICKKKGDCLWTPAYRHPHLMALLTVGLSYDFILLDSKGQVIHGWKRKIKIHSVSDIIDSFAAVLNTI